MSRIRLNFKIISLAVSAFATLIVLLIVNPVTMPTNAARSTRSYTKFDAHTKSKITSTYNNPNPYYIYTSSTSNNSRTVIGFDSREIDNSKSGVVKLIGSSSGTYLGTGFVVNDHVIATAAHCVISNPNTIETINGVFLFNEYGGLLESVTPVEVHVPTEYINCINTPNVPYEKYHWAFDYALITVEEDLSEYANFNLAVSLDSFYPSTNVNGPELKITGFPQYISGSEDNTNSCHNKYTGSGFAKYYTNLSSYNEFKTLVYYDVDASSGNSGSPVYYDEIFKGNTYHSVIAIHTAGEYWASGTNSGVRITEDLISFYLDNSNINY